MTANNECRSLEIPAFKPEDKFVSMPNALQIAGTMYYSKLSVSNTNMLDAGNTGWLQASG